jgi:hypothetical protein
MRNKLIANKAQCAKCKDIIESVHRHDFVTCKCGSISVDGGLEYLKRSARDPHNLIELSIIKEDKD